ncbi:uncharacterized protein LOC117305888 [Asterias rubens]|uniref:uncharacterized protein LOC117305888 n=1 Tax=Asterias rubens TaxID=7604 RepID=UPI001455B9E2|nr:uncharacterized protein LOC117305888 [Asterias rubens]
MASEIANVVSFCQPLGTSETVCHNVSFSRMIRELPLLPPIPIDCNVDPSPTCPTPWPGCGTIAPMPPGCGTTPMPPADTCNTICWIILAIIAIISSFAAASALVYFWKKRYFKDIFWINSHDNESRSGTDGPPDADVELHATDVENDATMSQEIGNPAVQ